MADEIRIRNKATGEEFVGAGAVPDGYEVVAPKADSFLGYVKQRTDPPQPSKSTVGAIYDQTLGRVSRAFQGAIFDASGANPDQPLPGGVTTPRSIAEPVAKGITPVPERLRDALAMGGAMVGGPILGTILAAGGEGLGSKLEGETNEQAASDAMWSGGINAGMRALTAIVPWLGRSVSNNPIFGGKRNIGNDYTEDVLGTLRTTVPEVYGNAKTAEDLVPLIRGARGTYLPSPFSQHPSGEDLMSGMIETARTNIKGTINNRPLRLTSMPGRPNPQQTAQVLDAQGRPVGVNTSTGQGSDAFLDDALGMLTDLYNLAYRGRVTNPALSGMQQQDAAMAAQQLKQEVSAELLRLDPTGGALKTFQDSQNKYAITMVVQDVLDKALALSPARGIPGTGVRLDESKLQQAVFDRLYDVTSKMGRTRVADQEFNQNLAPFLSAVYRGGSFGRSIPSTGSGDFGDSFRRAYGQGQGGTPAGVAALPKAGLENAGAVYSGKVPLELPEDLKKILAVGAQKAQGDVRR